LPELPDLPRVSEEIEDNSDDQDDQDSDDEDERRVFRDLFQNKLKNFDIFEEGMVVTKPDVDKREFWCRVDELSKNYEEKEGGFGFSGRYSIASQVSSNIQSKQEQKYARVADTSYKDYSLVTVTHLPMKVQIFKKDLDLLLWNMNGVCDINTIISPDVEKFGISTGQATFTPDLLLLALRGVELVGSKNRRPPRNFDRGA